MAGARINIYRALDDDTDYVVVSRDDYENLYNVADLYHLNDVPAENVVKAAQHLLDHNPPR